MAFEYGAEKLNIKNPFRFEGLVRSIRGLCISGAGVYLLLQIQPLLATDKTRAWIALALGALFILGGLKVLGEGLFQMMRFFVGRAAPASLAKNVAREAVSETEPGLYNPQTLHKMLMNRANPTFVEPRTWFARAVHSIFPNLLTTPWPVRFLAQAIAMKVAKTLVAVTAYLIATLVLYMSFAGSAGGEAGFSVAGMALQLLLLVYLVVLWTGIGNPLARANMRNNRNFDSKGLGLVLVGAIALPIGVTAAWQAIWDNMSAREMESAQALIPRIESMLEAGWLLALVILGALVAAAIVFVLVRARIRLLAVHTASSEKNDSWRFDLHPRQIFTTLRDFVLMERRELQLPNRHYLDENDTAQANRDNEQFNGDMISEIQPVASNPEEPGLMRGTRIGGTVLAQLLLLASPFVLWAVVERTLVHIRTFSDLAATGTADVDQAFATVFEPASSSFLMATAALFLFGLGRTLDRATHIFWSEIFFESRLFDLHCEGTVMRATHYRGADRHSASSEQDVFSFDATYFALGTRLISSTFAVSGQQNLEQVRYILSFTSDDGFVNGIIGDLEDQFRRRDDEIKADKKADREERLDYIRQEQEARRTGDMTAQGLVPPQQPDAIEGSREAPLEEPAERQQVRRWEGEGD